jgi:hypothetical protein
VRTTLSIDDDVLVAAKAIADAERKSLGEVISTLARLALSPKRPAPSTRNGVALLPLRPDAKPVTLEIVNRLRDELP